MKVNCLTCINLQYCSTHADLFGCIDGHLYEEDQPLFLYTETADEEELECQD